jgi:hypothetical protein
LPLGWVARFDLPGEQPGLASSLMRGYNYGTADANDRWRQLATLLGWEPFDTPGEPKFQRASFWAPSSARPTMLEYFDGRQHIQIRMKQIDDPRTDAAPVSEEEFRRIGDPRQPTS